MLILVVLMIVSSGLLDFCSFFEGRVMELVRLIRMYMVFVVKSVLKRVCG